MSHTEIWGTGRSCTWAEWRVECGDVCIWTRVGRDPVFSIWPILQHIFTGSPPSAVTTGYWSAQPPAGSEDTATCWADVRNPPAAGITHGTSTHGHVEKKKKKNMLWSRSPQHAELPSHGVERSAGEKVRLRYWKHLAAPVNPDPLQAGCQVPPGLKWPDLTTVFWRWCPIHSREKGSTGTCHKNVSEVISVEIINTCTGIEFAKYATETSPTGNSGRRWWEKVS